MMPALRKACAVVIALGAAPWIGAQGGPCAAIINSEYAFLKVHAFRTVTVTSDRKSGKVLEKMTAEFAAPDHMHMVTEARGKTDVRDFQLDPRNRSAIDEIVRGMSDCRRVGRDVVGSFPATVYQFTVEVKNAPRTTTKVWIADQDGLARKQEIETETSRTVQLVEIDPRIQPHVR